MTVNVERCGMRVGKFEVEGYAEREVVAPMSDRPVGSVMRGELTSRTAQFRFELLTVDPACDHPSLLNRHPTQNRGAMHVAQPDYFDALDVALDRIHAIAPDAPRPLWFEHLAAIVSWAYDGYTGSTADTLDGLPMLDLSMRDIALTIIVGRCHHHRPNAHPRLREIEALCWSRAQERSRAAGRGVVRS